MLFLMRKCSPKNSVSVLTLLLSVILILPSISCSANASDSLYVGYFSGEGLKSWNGSSWTNFNDGLPSGLSAEQIISDSKGNIYLTTEFSGIFRRASNESVWRNISSELFRRRTQLLGVNEFRRISSFCIDPANESKLFLATKHTLYSSNDSGKSWNKILISNNKNSYYFTSLVIANGTLYAGTSFNGVIKITNNRAEELSNGVPREYYAGTLHFCDETSALASSGNVLYSGFLFGKGFAVLQSANRWEQIPVALKNPATEGVYSITPFKKTVFIATDEAIYQYSPESKKMAASPLDAEIRKSFKANGPQLLLVKGSANNPPISVKRNIVKYDIEKTNKAGDKRAVYVSWSMINKDFNGFVDLAVRNKFNAVIIDIKDDFGIINAPVESKIAKEIGAVRNTNIREIIKTLHKKGIYVIARNVTFKDKKLFESYDGKYAIWDKVSDKPWIGLPRERWCDPYSKFVRDYNIEIARETAKLGFDEIQFDYIRFPTDGQTGRCRYRYRENDDTFKSEIMGDFLQQARKEAGVPVSVDIYGYNAWYRFGNLIGQDIEFLSRFVDVVCPMVYPSHFGAAFYKRYEAADRPYWIVRDSTIRSIYLSHNRAVMRQWIQDFKYQSPTWGPDYILKQIKGVQDGGSSSYSLWNPAGDHSMADRALGGK